MNEILVKCQYLCTYIRVAEPRSLIAPAEGEDGWMDGWNGRRAGGAAVIPCRKLYQRNTSAKAGNTCAVRATCPDGRFLDSRCAVAATARPAGCPAAATVTGKVICQRMN